MKRADISKSTTVCNVQPQPTTDCFLHPIKEPAGNGSPRWPCPHGLVFFFFPLVLLILSCVLTDDEKALCTWDICIGERWRTSGRKLAPHKLTCQKEREREKRTSVLFSINLLLLGKHSLRETTFVTLTDFVSQTLKRQERPEQKERKVTDHWRPLCSALYRLFADQHQLTSL